MKNIHKDLQKFGDNIYEYTMFNTKYKDEDASRQKTFDKQRQTYGFDDRELYNLDCTTIEWLYTHLVRYYHLIENKVSKNGKFRVPIASTTSPYVIKYKKQDFNTCLELAIQYFEFFLQSPLNFGENQELAYEFAKYGMEIYAEILPYLWY